MHGRPTFLSVTWPAIGQQSEHSRSQAQRSVCRPHALCHHAVARKASIARNASAAILRVFEGRGQRDRADDCCIEGIEIFGWNPVLLVVGRTGDLHRVG